MRRAVWFMTVLVAAAGAVVWYFEGYRYEKKKETERLANRLFALENKQIEEITIAGPDGAAQLARDSRDAWNITSPIKDKADKGTVSGILSRLETLEQTRVIAENPSDLAGYGLKEPSLTVTFRIKGEKEAQSLLFGEHSPTGSLYVKRGDRPAVYLIGQWVESTFKVKLDDLRDKHMFDFVAGDATKLLIERRDGGVLAFEKTGEDWALTRPVAAPADNFQVRGLLGYLSGLRHKERAEGKGAGLDKPWAKVSVTLVNAKDPQVLLVGDPAAKGDNPDAYARAADREFAVKVEGRLRKDLDKPASDFRDKVVVKALAAEVKRMEVEQDGRNWSILHDGETWRSASPEKRDLAKEPMESIVALLDELRVQEFVDDAPKDLARYGLGKPALRIVFQGEDAEGKPRPIGEFLLGGAVPGKGYYAKRGDRGYVFRIDETFKKEFDSNWQNALKPAEKKDEKPAEPAPEKRASAR